MLYEVITAEVKWDNATQTVTAKKDGTTVKLTISVITSYSIHYTKLYDDARGVTAYTLDAYGRAVAITDAVGETTYYTYDANDRVLTEKDGNSQVQYIYNDGYRSLTTVDGENNQLRETYDVMGRLLRQEELRPAGNVTLASYTYDYMGNRTSSYNFV